MQKIKTLKKFIIYIFIIYISSIAAEMYFIQRVTTIDLWEATEYFTLDPSQSFQYVFFSLKGFLAFMVSFVFFTLFYKFAILALNRGYVIEDDRNFKLSSSGTYGTARWMSENRMKNLFKISKPSQTKDIILARMQNDTDVEYAASLEKKPSKFRKPKFDKPYVGSPSDDVLSYNPSKHMLNGNIAVFGSAGTGKSQSFVKNYFYSAVARGESVICSDSKGDLFRSNYLYFLNNGYKVRIFNLVSPKNSDSWNCLGEIVDGEPDEIEELADTFARVIVENSSGTSKVGGIFDDGIILILKAMTLYIALDETLPTEQKTVAYMCEIINRKTTQELEILFDTLPEDHPAKAPWNAFKKSSANLSGNLKIGLESRLQLFQSKPIKNITSFSEIDLIAPAKEKCAYFLILPDQTSTYQFLSSLFFSFAFIKQAKYADMYGPDMKTPVPIKYLLDELANIGIIPNLNMKFSTLRSRGIDICPIFQSLPQLKDRYPTTWGEILGNCDTKLFLGCSEEETAEYISRRTGPITTEVESSRRTVGPLDIPQGATKGLSSGEGKRVLLDPNEVERLPNTDCLIIIRGENVLRAKKFYAWNHPEYNQSELFDIRNYVPKWREAMENREAEKKNAKSNINPSSILINSELNKLNNDNPESLDLFSKEDTFDAEESHASVEKPIISLDSDAPKNIKINAIKKEEEDENIVKTTSNDANLIKLPEGLNF